MLYIFTSILFFLFAFRSVLFWTAVWQKSGYKVAYLKHALTGVGNTFLLVRAIFGIAIFLLILSYGPVIVNDSLIHWYQAAIMVFFTIGSAAFIGELMQNSFIKPRFSMKTLLISLIAVFAIGFLYMVPLVDTYLWLLAMLIFIPFIVTFLVVLFAFPSEIYEDYFFQTARKELQKNKQMHTIAFVGDRAGITQKYLSSLLDVSSYTFIEMKRDAGLLATASALKKSAQLRNNFFIFHIPPYAKELEKLLQLVQPHVVIFGNAFSSQFSKKNIENILSHMGKNGVALVNPDTVPVLDILARLQKKVILYGAQKTSHGKKVGIVAQDIKRNGKQLSLRVVIGKDIVQLKNISVGSSDNFLFLLPAIFLARKMGIPVAKIQKVLAKN